MKYHIFFYSILLQWHLIPLTLRLSRFKFKDGVLVKLSKHIVFWWDSQQGLVNGLWSRRVPKSAQHCLILTIRISKEYNPTLWYRRGKRVPPLHRFWPFFVVHLYQCWPTSCFCYISCFLGSPILICQNSSPWDSNV